MTMSRQCADLLVTPLGWNEACLKTLVRWEETEILAKTGLTLQSYGTARLISGDAKACRVWILEPPLVAGSNFGVEELPASLHYIATEQGTGLIDIADQNQAETLALFRNVCETVARISPAIWQSMCYLLRSVHIISSPCSETDVSFSLPHLPNTIFISLPRFDDENAVARLIESIVHEVLHLQLSLVESCCPIVRSEMATENMYSPWRDSLRPEGGVVHGLFVFANLEKLWLKAKSSRSERLSLFAEQRVDEIREQICHLNSRAFRTLTDFGKRIVSGLVDSNNSPVECPHFTKHLN